MIAAAIIALASHWRTRPLQFVILLIGLTLATGLWTGVQAINSEARSSYERAAASLGRDTLHRLEASDGRTIEPNRFVALRRAGWLVSPVVEGALRIDGNRLRVQGIDVFTLPGGSTPLGLSGDTDITGFVAGEELLLVHPDTMAALINSDLNLHAARRIPPGTLIGDVATAWRLLGRQDFDYLVLAPDQTAGLKPLAELAPDLRRVAADPQADIARLTDSFHLNLTAFGFLAFAVGLFIVHATIGLAFEQRRPVIRTLRALGLANRTLILLLLAETLLMALLAGLIGIVFGYAIAAALLPDVAATLRGLYDAAVPGSLSLRPDWVLTGLAMALAGALLAAGQGLWRMARLPLLAPAQPRAWAMASLRDLRLGAMTGVALLLVALAAALFGQGLSAGFTTLGALLLGAALLLPALLTGALALGARTARSALAEWVWADMRQQVPNLSLALMALMLALAANIGVGTMVTSFRQTFTGWLDQRLAAELYVSADSEAQAAELRTFLEGRADAVLPIRNHEIEFRGQPLFLYGVIDHATYRDHWPLLQSIDDVWDRIAAGDGVLINEQLHRREGVSLGDRIPLTPDWREEVVGIYSDYGNPTGQAIVQLERLMQVFPDVSQLRHAVRIGPERTEALTNALVGEFGLEPGNIVDQDAMKRFSLDIFDRTFLVTGALNTLTLCVAGFAMLANLLTLATMRVTQLAPVWAAGMTRSSLARLELMRTLGFAVLTWVAAIPVGLMLAWVLLVVVNVEAFGWRLPIILTPVDWLWLLCLAMLAAGLAAIAPAWRLARTRPAQFLKVFAHER